MGRYRVYTISQRNLKGTVTSERQCVTDNQNYVVLQVSFSPRFLKLYDPEEGIVLHSLHDDTVNLNHVSERYCSWTHKNRRKSTRRIKENPVFIRENGRIDLNPYRHYLPDYATASKEMISVGHTVCYAIPCDDPCKEGIIQADRRILPFVHTVRQCTAASYNRWVKGVQHYFAEREQKVIQMVQELSKVDNALHADLKSLVKGLSQKGNANGISIDAIVSFLERGNKQ